MTVCSCHVTYAFESESTLYSCLNVKELLARSSQALLPVCGKIFERIIFNSLHEYVEEKKLLSVHQSGFRSNNSCVNQLLSIVHNLHKAFDAYPTLETHGVFLDMSIRLLIKSGTKGKYSNSSQLGFQILC